MEAGGTIMSDKKQTKLVRVRPDKTFTSKRNLNYFPGLSENTAGTQNLSMMLVRIPPEARRNRIIMRGSRREFTFWKAKWITCTAKA